MVITIPVVMFFVGVFVGYCCTQSNSWWWKAFHVLTFGGLKFGMYLKKRRGRRCLGKFKKQKTPSIDMQSTGIPEVFKFSLGNPAPSCLDRPVDAVVGKSDAYFRPYGENFIYRYHIESRKWSKLKKKCPVRNTSLAILPINNRSGEKTFVLHIIGGSHKSNDRVFTNALQIYSNAAPYWSKSPFSRMNEKRQQVTAICDNKYEYLVAAGGKGEHGATSTVEILNLSENTWSKVENLPVEMYRASGCICGDTLYILGGRIVQNDKGTEINYAFKASFSKLLENTTEIFESIADLRCERSACVLFCDRLFAIGGVRLQHKTKKRLSTNLIYEYIPKADTWRQVKNSMKKNRCHCFAISLTKSSGEQQLMIVGGFELCPNNKCTNTSEIGTLVNKSGQTGPADV